MDRIKHLELIKAIENEYTKNIIGKVDICILEARIPETLYYAFPLIERLILEIYKQIPDADVEQYEQGTSKTVISIIKSNDKDTITNESKHLIYKYFDGDNALRNNIFHVLDNKVNIEVIFDEIYYIILDLLLTLRTKIEENDRIDFKQIEYL